MENKIKLEEDNKLSDIISTMTFNNSFWGYLFSRLRRIPVEDEIMMGVGVVRDGTIALFYNQKRVDQCKPKDIIKIIEHEGLHIINNHLVRVIKLLTDEIDIIEIESKKRIWNIATDACVNCQIKDMPRIMNIGDEEWKLVFPDIYKLNENESAEIYYDKLNSKREKEEKIKIKIEGSGLGTGEGKEGSETETGEGKEGSEEGTGAGKDSCNNHKYWKNPTGDSSFPRQIEQYAKDMVYKSLKNFNKSRGTLPGNLELLINEFLQPPKLPYYEIIRRSVKATYNKSKVKKAPVINRKRGYMVLWENKFKSMDLPMMSPFPGKKSDYAFHILVIIDTSQSMTKDDICEGLSSLKDIIEKDKYCKTTVIENDTEVRKEYELKKINDIQFDIAGRGGTILAPALLRAIKIKPRIDVALIFTDGYCESINEIDRTYMPHISKLIWVVTNDGTTKYINRSCRVIVIDK